MVYVFDTNSFIVLSHYYKKQFPSLWKKIDSQVKADKIISVKEALNEIESYGQESDLKIWTKNNKKIFQAMSVGLYPIYLKNIQSFKTWLAENPVCRANLLRILLSLLRQYILKAGWFQKRPFKKMGLKFLTYAKLKMFPA